MNLFKLKNKSIVFLTPTLWPYSGIDRVVEQESKLLSKHNQVAIICLDAKIKIPGVKIYVFGMPTYTLLQRVYRLLFFLDIPKIFKIVRLLKNSDIVVAHQYPLTIPAALTKFLHKTPYYIYRDYGVPPAWTFNSLIEKIYIELFRLLTHISVLNSDLILSISSYLAKTAKQEFSNKNIYHDYPKIKFPKPITKISKTKLFKNLDISVYTKHTALFIGRLSPHKGVDTLIKATTKIKDLHTLIIGKPTFPAYFDYLKKIAKNKNVSFLHNVNDSDLNRLMCVSDIYITCSSWEGYNIPLHQALSFGKKAIAFDLAAHSELKGKYDNLILVLYTSDKNKNINSVAKAIKQSLNIK